MNLDDFEQSGDKDHSRFVMNVQDVSGDEQFELTIAGPRALIRRVLADATIELTVELSEVKGGHPEHDRRAADGATQNDVVACRT